jgi:2-phosphosulfolactate phosphatase
MRRMNDAHRQGDYQIRLDWGPLGGQAIARSAGCAVVVDVLSFTTTLSDAIDAGIRVYPYPWADESAREFAGRHDARLAVGRSVAKPGDVSLSPSTIRAAHGIQRLVLPSPNGATISSQLTGTTLVAASLRNRRAVAEHLAGATGPIAVIASGERWPDGTLRPAIEDFWGAGGVIDALLAAGATNASPEAYAAAATYRQIADIRRALADCASGRELIAAGYADDVAIAAELDESPAVPRLGPDRSYSSIPG